MINTIKKTKGVVVKRRNLGADICMAVIICLFIICPVLAFGQAAVDTAAQTGLSDAPAVGAAELGRMSWQQVMKSGGVLMYVLGVVSFIVLALIMYFAVILRQSQVVPLHLYRELMDKIDLGAIDDARKACEYRPSALSMVAISGIDYVTRIPNTDPNILNEIIEGEGSRQAEALHGQTQLLADIGAIAPMLGLLGTVFGMLRAFGGVALDIANAKPVVLAAGVSQALITTAFGLIVGIAAMAAYAFFRRKASKLTATLEAAATDIMTALLSRSSSPVSLRENVLSGEEA